MGASSRAGSRPRISRSSSSGRRPTTPSSTTADERGADGARHRRRAASGSPGARAPERAVCARRWSPGRSTRCSARRRVRRDGRRDSQRRRRRAPSSDDGAPRGSAMLDVAVNNAGCSGSPARATDPAAAALEVNLPRRSMIGVLPAMHEADTAIRTRVDRRPHRVSGERRTRRASPGCAGSTKRSAGSAAGCHAVSPGPVDTALWDEADRQPRACAAGECCDLSRRRGGRFAIRSRDVNDGPPAVARLVFTAMFIPLVDQLRCPRPHGRGSSPDGSYRASSMECSAVRIVSSIRFVTASCTSRQRRARRFFRPTRCGGADRRRARFSPKET